MFAKHEDCIKPGNRTQAKRNRNDKKNRPRQFGRRTVTLENGGSTFVAPQFSQLIGRFRQRFLEQSTSFCLLIKLVSISYPDTTEVREKEANNSWKSICNQANFANYRIWASPTIRQKFLVNLHDRRSESWGTISFSNDVSKVCNGELINLGPKCSCAITLYHLFKAVSNKICTNFRSENKEDIRTMPHSSPKSGRPSPDANSTSKPKVLPSHQDQSTQAHSQLQSRLLDQTKTSQLYGKNQREGTFTRARCAQDSLGIEATELPERRHRLRRKVTVPDPQHRMSVSTEV